MRLETRADDAGPPLPRAAGRVTALRRRGAGGWLAVAGLALAVLASRASFLPPTLEDIDSVNFALALERFDPARHQPHPPGAPLYVATARAVHALVPEPPRALSWLSALSQAALVLPLVVLLGRLASGRLALALATLLVVVNPVLWLNGARPMSDSFGLLVVFTAQALLLAVLVAPREAAAPAAAAAALPGAGWLLAGSLLAGLAPGVRLQAAALTWPLWLLALVRQRGRRLPAFGALCLGVVLWIVPLVVAAGGPARYLAAFGYAWDDSVLVEPLVTRLTLNRLARTLVHVLVRPWASDALGLVLLALACWGALALFLRRRRTLALALVAFGPYLAAHALFQEARTIRYSLPYVPLLAWLAAEAISGLVRRLRPAAGAAFAAAAGAALVAWSASLALPALGAYAAGPSPPFAALEDVRREAQPPEGFVLGGHYMFFRYLPFAPPGLEVLPPLVRDELAGLGAYWREGRERPLVFLAEPERTDLEAIDPRARRVLARRSWAFDGDRLLAGERPNHVDVVRIDPPRWFTGEGWLLTLEAGRVADQRGFVERRAWLRRAAEPYVLLLAGEALAEDAVHYELEVRLAGERIAQGRLGTPLLAGFLLPPAAGPGFLELVVATRRQGRLEGAPLALRGLAWAPASEPSLVHGPGWHYPETDEKRRPFRWATPRARSLVYAPAAGARLRVAGHAPLEYVGSGQRAEARVDGVLRWSAELARPDFAFEVPLPSAGRHEVELSSDRSFVPDRFQRNGDRRELALRIYRYELTPD